MPDISKSAAEYHNSLTEFVRVHCAWRFCQRELICVRAVPGWNPASSAELRTSNEAWERARAGQSGRCVPDHCIIEMCGCSGDTGQTRMIWSLASETQIWVGMLGPSCIAPHEMLAA